ncbi:MAG: T9SS type A sorting domain-containing protein [Flavobacteriaceae bacterium]
MIDLGIDSDGIINGQVLTSDIVNVLTLDVSAKGINDLTGIEGFAALEDLNVRLNQLTTINVSNNTSLKKLDCWGNNNLSFLDLTNNTFLEVLIARATLLSTLNLSNNTSLKSLNCSFCPLASLDLSNNTDLEYLEIADTSISSIDLSNNTALTFLNCNGTNSLLSLDLSNNLQLEYLGIIGAWLDEIDLKNNTALKTLYASGNFLINIDLSSNINLEFLEITDNLLEGLDLTNNPLLKELYCGNPGQIPANEITSLDLSNNPNLEILHAENLYSLTSLNLKNGNNIILTEVYIDCLFEGYPCLLPLNCVEVDNEVAANNNHFPYIAWYIDASFVYSEDCSLSSPAFEKLTSFFVYPNPVNESLSIYTTFCNSCKVKIFSPKGKLLYNEILKASQDKIDVKQLSNGMYFIVVENEVGIKQTEKFVKK